MGNKLIDFDKLLKFIGTLDPCYVDSVEMKWMIIKKMTDMAQEQTDERTGS